MKRKHAGPRIDAKTRSERRLQSQRRDGLKRFHTASPAYESFTKYEQSNDACLIDWTCLQSRAQCPPIRPSRVILHPNRRKRRDLNADLRLETIPSRSHYSTPCDVFAVHNDQESLTSRPSSMTVVVDSSGDHTIAS